MTISINGQLFFLNQKLTGWQNTYYDATVDVKMGADIGNVKLVDEGTERMKMALKAITWLEDAITELETQTDELTDP